MLKALMYHYVSSAQDNEIFSNIPSLSTDILEDQIKFLLREYSPITHNELSAFFLGQKELPKKAFILTFDDGFKQHFNNVYPILKHYNLEGSFFIPTMPLIEQKTHFLEKQRVVQYATFEHYSDFLQIFWQECEKKLPKQLRKYTPTKYNIANMSYLRQFTFYTDEERYFRFLRDKIIPKEILHDVIDIIFYDRFKNEKNFIKQYYLTPQEIKSMANGGMNIGAHSHSHPYLTKIGNKDMQQEILQSFDYLEKMVQTKIESFSYPYGIYNEEVIEFMKTTNALYSYTTAYCIKTTLEQARYTIPRIDASEFDKIC